jgi:hypothetical protein
LVLNTTSASSKGKSAGFPRPTPAGSEMGAGQKAGGRGVAVSHQSWTRRPVHSDRSWHAQMHNLAKQGPGSMNRLGAEAMGLQRLWGLWHTC